MARRVALSNLNATTIDILNTIRQNASYQYQQLVPTVAQALDVPKVGEVLVGYPALANEFLSTLMNRIAIVRVKSLTFNNAYANLKKGYLEYGETVEEVFVNICKAREFSAEKAAGREFKRSIPDVKTAFHSISWKVQYPITIEDEQLRAAFLSADGVTDLISRIVGSISAANEYDELLLFKYLIVKGVTKGTMFPVAVDSSDIKNSAVAFRGTSNKIGFPSNKYNSYGVTTATPKSDQVIIMSADFNAQYDVNVLAAAFNMDKAYFMGRLYLIDDFSTFDNDRFSEIMAESDKLEEVTEDELAMMANVQAILCDQEYFQVYDNLTKFTEKYVASGLYWNYFLNVWKTVSYSPFSNAVVFVDSTAETDLPTTITVEITDKSVGENATTLTLTPDFENPIVNGGNVNFVQTQAATQNGIAIHPYGGVMFPAANNSELTLVATVGGVTYTAGSTISASSPVGGTVTLTQS